jgi:type 2 lantibiotic biosynthesis protein LanM
VLSATVESFLPGVLEGIVAAACPLLRRPRAAVQPYSPGDAAPDDAAHAAQVEARLAAWRAHLADGDPGALDTRLALEGLTQDDIVPYLGPARPVEGAALPAWAGVLRDALRAAGPLLEGGDPAGEPHPHPFGDALEPFVAEARERLCRRAALDALGDGVLPALCDRLTAHLAGITARTLNTELGVLVLRETSGLDRLVRRLAPTPSRVQYRRFVDHLRAGGWSEIFTRYPVLARLLGTAVVHWVDHTVDWVQRLAGDRPLLEAMFHAGRPLGKVVEVSPGLSDPHDGGRSVIALVFEAGCRLIYKPRPVAMLHALQRFLAWLFEAAPHLLDMRTLKVLPRGAYGWVEYVEHRPCESRDELARYYRRAGALLCHAYALGGNDMHHENVVAAGEYPVLVDAETLMGSDLSGGEGPSFYAGHEGWDTVLRTGFLPSWTLDDTGVPVDVSALGAVRDHDLGAQRFTWRHRNTDLMTADRERLQFSPRDNVPVPTGGDAALADHEDAVVAGFQDAYEALRAHQGALVREDGPLRLFAGCTSRLVVRPTQAYAHLSQHLLQPGLLRDGVDRSIILDALAREPLRWLSPPAARRLLRHEIDAMERLDVPCFAGPCDATFLELPPAGGDDGGNAASVGLPVFTVAGLERTRRRIAALSDDDLRRQIAYIRGAFASRRVRGDRVARPGQASEDADHDDPDPATAWREAARRIVATIRASALRRPQGGAAFMVLQEVSSIQRYRLQPMGHDLYHGQCGVALFLAAYAWTERCDATRALALETLADARAALQRAATHGDAGLAGMPVGGLYGFGSLVYALTRIGAWLDEPELRTEARAAADQLTEARLGADSHHDLLLGLAGAIAALLALYEATPARDAELLRRACLAGELLLSREHRDGGWVNGDGKRGAGASHGAAGIGLSLARLYAHTGQARWRAAIERAVRFENTLHDPAIANWHYLARGTAARELAPSGASASWCHGAPGIALARGLTLRHVEGTELAHLLWHDVSTAVETLRRAAGHTEVDHLCCGTAGLVDIELELGALSDRPEWTQHARQTLAAMTRRAHRRGSYRLDLDLVELTDVSFFKGLAGIGYVLLRALHPRRLPSVLALA